MEYADGDVLVALYGPSEICGGRVKVAHFAFERQCCKEFGYVLIGRCRFEKIICCYANDDAAVIFVFLRRRMGLVRVRFGARNADA